jgi:hypothetical protein
MFVRLKINKIQTLKVTFVYKNAIVIFFYLRLSITKAGGRYKRHRKVLRDNVLHLKHLNAITFHHLTFQRTLSASLFACFIVFKPLHCMQMRME